MNDPNKPPPKEEAFMRCIVCGKKFPIPPGKYGDPGWLTCDDCFAPFADDEAAWEGDDVQ